jgi:ubiquinone/menaquinone biosynthesis C-methylase UbiE
MSHAVTAPPAEVRSRGLVQADFRPVARRGFGDPHNSYPHALTWFNDRLYVSTTRDNLVLVKQRYPFEVPLAAWPVPVPEDLWTDIDLRAQIWRYDPPADRWTMVFQSPLVKAQDGKDIPLVIAFRAMAVFQGASDPAPAIYAPTLAPGRLGQDAGSVMMRTFDGERFETLSEIGADLGLGRFRGFRALQPFGGRLFTAPVMGTASAVPNVAGTSIVLVSRDPGRGKWELANLPNFGDPNNEGIFEMGEANGFLYAGCVNLAEGFQVWKTDARGDPPYRWTRVLSRGAYRGRLNQGTVAMTAFGDHLYVSAAIQGAGYDRANNVGPAAAELMRIAADDSWDLIVGDARVTPEGMKAPLSGFGAGFGNPSAGYFWRMCEHEGWLYLGTLDTSVFLTWHRDFDVLPPHVKNILDPGSIEDLVRRFSGFHLWRTRDGIRWIPVSTNGLGNRFNYGARTMVSTPHGLFVGATNPFGPEIAVRRAGGWVYEPNPTGGAEIWLGSTRAGDPGGGDPPPPPPLVDTITAEGNPELDAALCERLVAGYYRDTGFRHFGCWRGEVADAVQACESLVEELLSFLPDRSGSIVEVGCGRGATTAYLLRHYPAAAVTGICEDSRHLEECRQVAPGVRFMPGVPRLRLPDESVDVVICAEGIAAQKSKAAALREMARVLRPGGHLVLADILFTADWEDSFGRPGVPMDHAAIYRHLMESAGLVEARVVNATYECWTKYNQHRYHYFGIRVLSQQIDAHLLEPLKKTLPGGQRAVSAYVLASARKRGDGTGTP